MAKVILHGQTIALPDEVAETDDDVIRALTPLYPDAANAEIGRKQEGGETVITVVKRPGTKGAAQQVLESLRATPSEANPAVSLCLALRRENIEQASPDELLAWRERTDMALEAGEAELEDVRATLKGLIEARREFGVPFAISYTFA